MTADLVALLYLVAGVLFILALRGLSSPETSRRGNLFGMVGMAIAIVTTLAWHPPVGVVARHDFDQQTVGGLSRGDGRPGVAALEDVTPAIEPQVGPLLVRPVARGAVSCEDRLHVPVEVHGLRLSGGRIKQQCPFKQSTSPVLMLRETGRAWREIRS